MDSHNGVASLGLVLPTGCDEERRRILSSTSIVSLETATELPQDILYLMPGDGCDSEKLQRCVVRLRNSQAHNIGDEMAEWSHPLPNAPFFVRETSSPSSDILSRGTIDIFALPWQGLHRRNHRIAEMHCHHTTRAWILMVMYKDPI
jgi:hypothetical protein